MPAPAPRTSPSARDLSTVSASRRVQTVVRGCGWLRCRFRDGAECGRLSSTELPRRIRRWAEVRQDAGGQRCRSIMPTRCCCPPSSKGSAATFTRSRSTRSCEPSLQSSSARRFASSSFTGENSIAGIRTRATSGLTSRGWACHSGKRLRAVQHWRRGCEGLALSFDRVLARYIAAIAGSLPW